MQQDQQNTEKNTKILLQKEFKDFTYIIKEVNGRTKIYREKNGLHA